MKLNFTKRKRANHFADTPVTTKRRRKMVKAQRKSKERSAKQAAFHIIEQAQDAKLVKESVGDGPLFFEDRKPAENTKMLPRRMLKVDEILTPKSSTKRLEPVKVSKKGAQGSEAKLAKRYSKSKKQPKAAKSLKDPWAEDAEDARADVPARKSVAALVEPVIPQAMSYRPNPTDQMRILEAIEREEQRKAERANRIKEEAEAIKKAITEPDLQNPYVTVMNEREGCASASSYAEESLTLDMTAPIPTVTKGKGKKERIQEQREKAEKRAAEQRKEERKFERQFDQLEAIAKRVKKEASAANQKRKRAGAKKAVAAKITAEEVILPEQVPAGLREISTAGNLVSDVYRSLKKRVAIGDRHRKRTNTLALKSFTMHCYK